MTIKASEVYDAVVAAITGITADNKSGKGDVFVHHEGDVDELPKKDRRFAVVPLNAIDRVTVRGSCTELMLEFQVIVRHVVTGKADSWRRMLDDSEDLLRAIQKLHTTVPDVTRVFEDATDVLYEQRLMTSIREFTITFRGE